MRPRLLSSGLTIRNTQPGDASALEELQRVVFPTLADDQRFKARHYEFHTKLFPEGQFIVLDGECAAGAAAYTRMDFDFARPNHRFADVIEGGWLTSHDPSGEWLYGADIGVHPDHRSRGVGRALVEAAQELVRELGLRGIIAGGMMSGYGALSHRMTPREYYDLLLRGEVHDPTLDFQRRLGFEPRGLIENYLDDPACGNCGVLIVLPAEKG